MTRQKAYLLLTALFTLMLIVLILLGAYLLSSHSKQFAVAAFLFA
ncbi:NGO_0222 family membrane protein, partial [Neisseria sp. P0013.S005]